jgi:hypothetical protein
VDEFIREQLTVGSQLPAQLALGWLRSTPDALDRIKAVYAVGAAGDPDAFRAFAVEVWNGVDSVVPGQLTSLGIRSDDERNWVSTLALVVGAWGVYEMGQRGTA